MSHLDYMQRCLELAAIAKSQKQTAVGAMIVRAGKVMAEGIEGGPGLPTVLAHAEMIAIVGAIDALKSRDLSDCTLYTTVEPCIMCAFLARETKIRVVVYGTDAGQIGGAGSAYPILTTNKISRWKTMPELLPGIMETECRKMLVHSL